MGFEVMGSSMSRRPVRAGVLAAFRCLALAAALVTSPALAFAAERYVLIVVGAAGSTEHAERHAEWREALAGVLEEQLDVPADQMVSLSGDATDETRRATRENVEAALDGFGSIMAADDVLLLVLMGHGTFDGIDAKFNLVGPDLESAEWEALIEPVPGYVVFVNTTGASYPFLERLSADRRVIITATDSPAQRYDTVFAGFLAPAFSDAGSDLDKDGRVSIWEAFTFASGEVRRWYEQRGQLATERPLLEDTGDGQGLEAGQVGEDGHLAGRLFLDAESGGMAGADPELAQLVGRRNFLENELADLKRKRDFMPPGDYDEELERLVVAIARISRQIRARS